jgi:hypothetical protein
MVVEAYRSAARRKAEFTVTRGVIAYPAVSIQKSVHENDLKAEFQDLRNRAKEQYILIYQYCGRLISSRKKSEVFR